jgi:cellulose synthase (UDP-forming)
MKNNQNLIRIPNKQERLTLRLLILLGLLSITNFFYWFVKPDLIENHFLFWLILAPITFDCLRILYIWYHYWDISKPNKPMLFKKPTVDVLTTYFPGEPYEMVKETLLAIKRMKYPHTTYLCDEANDPHLIEFCREHEIVHVTRNNRKDAKAGNINNALKQATGEICLILDPDHVPKKNFLDEVIPYFEDESIGFVQTVQGYYNVNESDVARGAAEQTFLFYGPLMMTMNSYGTVNAIGANCVFRRKALDSIGGHAAGLSEDMHTAMQLHAKGWKSVYVPETYTKGLVPSSLTAYYKQQLKWSRGTLELLASVYPRLFGNFTWRQRIHYGLLPLYYLSGFFVLFSLLVPIISLFTATIPWKGNIINFGLMVLPVFTSMLGIRFYVQRWLADKSERGLHIKGGLLLACTWWVFIIGALFTLIRKKVPYLPTPKDDKDLTNWKILMPNIVLGIVSIIAAAYGLSVDYTPFSLFMAGFAMVNAGIMFYSVILAYQKMKPVKFTFDYAEITDPVLLLIQNFFYNTWNKAALPILILILFIFGNTYYQLEYVKWKGVQPEVQNKNSINYIGVFAPQINNGITSLANVHKISAQTGGKFDIVSLYLAWENSLEPNFPFSLMDSIYMQKSIPMITWEPWINFFEDEYKQGRHVFDLIEEGYFDAFIARFAENLKNLQRPVFLRFAHEFDNPFYPWYSNSDAAAAKFKKAWVHTYEIFKNNGAVNVIWIWNPWKSENIASFYPGKEYVDWFGVNVLNYGQFNQDETWHEFKNLYEPFHDEFKKLPSTPVMISEFGTLRVEPRQNEWFENAFYSIENEFDEIKSVIYFHSNIDSNFPNEIFLNVNLDWTIPEMQVMRNSFLQKNIPDYLFSQLPYISAAEYSDLSATSHVLGDIKGINIKKRRDWKQDYQVLNRNKLLTDFEKIKQLGINTIEFEGNTVYEYNILKTTKKNDLKVSYGFWIPEEIDFLEDTKKAEELKKSILKRISKRTDHDHIISWNIQNDVQYNQKDYFLKPRLLYQNSAYILWMQDLVEKIKQIDSTRPIIVDIEVNQLSVYHAKMLLNNVKGIDFLGLVVKETDYLKNVINYLKHANIKFIYSEIDVPVLIHSEILNSQIPFFITSWQDQHESNKLTFDGITDRKGRFKTDYFHLLNALQNKAREIDFPDIRILRPSVLIRENMTIQFHAVVFDQIQGWKYGRENNNLSFEWSLVKCDRFGNFLAIKDIGRGSRISLTVPKDHEYFRLLLTADNGESISKTITTLHTPLIHNIGKSE